jgi:N-methylhydantoinase A
VCRIDDGRPEVAYERDIDGLPCRLPAVAIHTVGAGGGSISWVDDGGALRVGPHSAGAEPGPACYGRGGTDATVTDANLLLGRLDPTGSLAGTVDLEADAAHQALTALGERAGLDPIATALGIVEVAEAHMSRAIRVVSVEEGADPRDAVLVSFGGAGGLHATSLARGLEMAGVVVPPYAGVFSAFGLLLSPRRTDRARSTPLAEAQAHDLAAIAASVAADARRELPGEDVTLSLLLDVRYIGQAHDAH